MRRPGGRPAAASATTGGPAADLWANRRELSRAVARPGTRGQRDPSDRSREDGRNGGADQVTGLTFLDLLAAGAFDFEIGPIPVRPSLLIKLFRIMFKGRRRGRSSRRPSRQRRFPRFADPVPRVAKGPVTVHRVPRRRRDRRLRHPAEWEALDDIVSRHLAQLGISDKPIRTNFGSLSAPLVSAVATHFQAVLKKAGDASLFCQT